MTTAITTDEQFVVTGIGALVTRPYRPWWSRIINYLAGR